MKNDQYFKLEATFLDDPRVVRMMAMLDGATAVGAYVLLLTHLRKAENYEAPYTYEDIDAFAYRNRLDFDLVCYIITEFNLFVIDKERQTFRSVYLDRVMEEYEKRAKKSVENGKKGGRPKKKINTPETPMDKGEKPNENQKKRKEKNTIAKDNSIKEEEEKSSSLSPSSSDDEFLDSSWEKWVDTMVASEKYMQEMQEHSGLGDLFAERRQEVVDIFKRHVRRFGKENAIGSMKAAKLYFGNYLSPGSRTANKLKEQLQAAAQKAADDNPYRFEYQLDGKRMFLGIPIPDDAPPRPSAQSFWNVHSHRWIG